MKLSQNLTQLAGLPQMVKQGEAEESTDSFFEGVKGRYECPQEQGKLLHFLSELPLLLGSTLPALSF